MQDMWGLEMTAPGTDELERFDALVDAYYTLAPDLPDRLAAAANSSDTPLSQIALGYFLLQAHTHADHAKATEAAARAATFQLNQREQRHLDALNTWLTGEIDDTADTWDQILKVWPTDALALRLQHFVLFSRGRLEDMLHSVQRSAVAWGDLPRRSYLEAMFAFPLEELGRYSEAEVHGRAGVEADPADLWAIHSVAHVFEMEGRTEEGLAWFSGRGDVLHASGSFARHLWWHHAIIHLRTGQHDRLMELYDTEIQPGDARDGLSITNAIDALARLEFAGVDVGDRWHPLIDAATARLGYHGHPFNDAHYAFAIARAGTSEQIETLLTGMTDWADRATTAATVIETVGLETAKGMAALGAGNRSEALSLLERSKEHRWQLGGSHAQRHVFELAESFART